MRRPDADHLALPWRVHALAEDFELVDVWRYPIVAPDDLPFDAFLEFMVRSQAELVSGRGVAAFLFRLRGWLGALFGWDRGTGTPRAATPDAESVRSRLPHDESESAEAAALPIEGEIGFDAVYLTPDESLGEIRNSTVHALMHLGRVEVDGGWSPQMAVYVKPRGAIGRLYMTAIGPFRHAIVYPAMMRSAARGWPTFLAERSESAD